MYKQINITSWPILNQLNLFCFMRNVSTGYVSMFTWDISYFIGDRTTDCRRNIKHLRQFYFKPWFVTSFYSPERGLPVRRLLIWSYKYWYLLRHTFTLTILKIKPFPYIYLIDRATKYYEVAILVWCLCMTVRSTLAFKRQSKLGNVCYFSKGGLFIAWTKVKTL